MAFESDGVQLSGDSGLYIPHAASGYERCRLATWAQGRYRRSVLALDHLMCLSSPHHLSTLLTADLAYDWVMKRAACLWRGTSARRTRTASIHRGRGPSFDRRESARALNKDWFLNDRSLPDGRTYLAAYEHTTFTHFGEGESRR